MGQSRGRVPAADRHIGAAFRTFAGDARFLLAYVNHPRPDRPWGELFTPTIYTIHGDAFTDAEGDALQQEYRRMLADLMRGHAPVHSLPWADLHVRCWWTGLTVEVDSDDLDEKLAWLIFDLARQHRDGNLIHCEACGRFVLAERPTKKRFCSARCRKRGARARRRASNRASQAKYRAKPEDGPAIPYIVRRGR